MLIGKLKALFVESDADERRRDPRQRVLLRATVIPIELCGDVRVLNASEAGLMGETELDLEVGQILHISMDGVNYLTGAVRWARGRRFGLALEDALQHLAGAGHVELGEDEGQVARQRRFDVNLPAKLMTGSAERAATVRNVSRSGMLLDHLPGLAEGQLLLIQVRDRAAILGSVQWCDGAQAGLKTAARIATLRLVYSTE